MLIKKKAFGFERIKWDNVFPTCRLCDFYLPDLDVCLCKLGNGMCININSRFMGINYRYVGKKKTT